MSIKKAFIISFIIGLLIPFLASAQIKISEIMYDPAGSDTKREWIEVYNAGTAAIDLSTYFFLENNVFHKLVAQAGSMLPSGAYAIIVDSVAEVLADYTGFAGLVFDSAFSLNNTGEPLVMADAQKITVDSFSYTADMGAAGDGNSLQITDGKVVTAGPTFGATNKTESEIPESEEETSTSTPETTSGTSGSTGSGGTSSHEQQVAATTYMPTADFKLGAGRTRTVLTNTPIEFEAQVSKRDIKPKLAWNFGDLETDTGRAIKHIYEHPGTYQVVLEGKTSEHTAVSRTEVIVYEPDLAFEQATGTLSIVNRLKKEVNIGGFVLNFISGFKVIPVNTLIKGGDSITVNRRPEEILESIEYPNGKTYLVLEPRPDLYGVVMEYCAKEKPPVVCKSKKLAQILVQ